MSNNERAAWACWLRLTVLLGVLLSGCSGLLKQSISRFEFLTPKPFGYVIGDEIRHRIIVETRTAIELNEASLPKHGALNRWLTINAVEWRQSETGGGLRYVVDIRYQVFYAPLEVKMLTIPAFTLQFKQGKQTIEQAVPSWHFTISPLRELAVRKDDSGEYMRPDAAPDRMAFDATILRLSLSLALFAISAAYLSYGLGYWPAESRRSIFRRAERKLARLPEHDVASALKILHQAFNTLNRKPLFGHQLEVFLVSRPDYRRLSAELNWFFDLSNRHFFGDRPEPPSEAAARLRRLCRRCRAIERSAR
ncbi:MAG: hypothetical protein Kow0065_17240 [Methylomicrobium sp.]